MEFAMIQEKIVSAMQSSNLAWHAEFERAIDRLTAIGMSDALGAALWRFRYLHDRAAYKRAHALLADKAEIRIKRKKGPYLFGLVGCAILEWSDDRCMHCEGTGLFAHPGNPVRSIKCSKCGGSGLRSYSDWERSNNCGLNGVWNAGHQKNFDAVMSCLTGSAAAAGGRARELLKDSHEGL